MSKLEQVVMRAINGNLGLPESETGYDARALAEKIKKITTRIVVPKTPTREFADFLQEGSDVSRFVSRSIESWDTISAMIFHALLGIPGEDQQRITPLMVARQFPGSPFIPMLGALVATTELTVGELKKAHEIAIAWHHKKLAGYVGEFWNQVKNQKSVIFTRVMQETERYKSLMPKSADDKVQISYVWNILQAALIGFSYALQKFIEMDPEFEQWAKVDTILNPSRLQTITRENTAGRANTVIKVWVGAGVDTAIGYMHVAFDKCQMHRASALALYRNSYPELFATIGMMDHPFIAAFSELIKKPKTVEKMAEPLRTWDINEMMNIFRDAHDQTFAHEVILNQDMLRTGSNAPSIAWSIQANQVYPYHADFFEITPEGKLRVKQWMIDFVRLMNANSSLAINEKINARGCPMMHGKTRPEEGNMVFMQDFAEFFAETMETYWNK